MPLNNEVELRGTSEKHQSRGASDKHQHRLSQNVQNNDGEPRGTSEKHQSRGTSEKHPHRMSQNVQNNDGELRGTSEKHHSRGTSDKHHNLQHQHQRGTPDKLMNRGTPERHRGTPERHRGTPDKQKQHGTVHHSRSRRNTDAENEILLAKRRMEVLRERRILIIMTGLCCLASAIWLVALSTDYWILIKRPIDGGKNTTETTLKSHLGVWRRCIVVDEKSADPSAGCSLHNLDHDSKEFVSQPSVAQTIIDYRRTVMALAGLSLLCHLMAVSFSFYTFRNPRYTFKRLAGALHLITVATMVVLIEVVSNGAEFTRNHLNSNSPERPEIEHGYSYYLAWLVTAQFVIAGLSFLIFSRKRKRLNILGEDGMPLADDEPQFMGRN